MLPDQNGTSQYTKLENRLVLLAWLNSLLGYASNRDLLDDMKKADEGFDAAGHSHIYHRLLSRGSQLKIPVEDLERYDGNIRMYLAAINAHRPEPITLRYFQYLAALYTEIVLDRYFNRRAFLLKDLDA
ncbi:MAG: restriction endonuclease subunit R, partial [Planctomycetota bacterium]|nr:restriction endonuclease subunit R [Planctomycetota bacterium]